MEFRYAVFRHLRPGAGCELRRISRGTPTDSTFLQSSFLACGGGRSLQRFQKPCIGARRSPCLTDPNFVPTLERSPYPNLGNGVQATANTSFSNYHSLQVRATQRLSRGLTFLANYTFSHSNDEISQNGGGFVGEAISIPQDSHNQRGDYGPSSFDQRHRFNFSYSYDLPVGKGQKWDAGRVGNWFVGGWNSAGYNYVCQWRSRLALLVPVPPLPTKPA